GKFQWQRLENMITMARSESNFDLLPTAQLGITFLLSEEGRYLRRQLLLALTEDDRLHTAEVQRLWGLIQGELQPRRLLDVAMSAFRELSSQGVAAVLPGETSSR
ncbi:MAG: AarF/ABC1/UbiB kinase family protein, partial [Microcystis sp. M53602_WE12]|nr:AarF/ABC1/UbiB kinase family protein [Microcystis sp. M53602_WE12]